MCSMPRFIRWRPASWLRLERRPWPLIARLTMPILLILAHPPWLHAHSTRHSSLVVSAPAPKPIDYDALTKEATSLLQQEVQINTTNPPGDELPVAKLLKEKFLADGIPATVWEPLPGRGAIIARMRGRSHRSHALILLSHMDVVPAESEGMAVPPFSGQIKDGPVWGRGSIDDKGPGAIELMAMLALKRAGILLNRDVIFIATGDEEEGGRNGAGWMVDHEADDFADAGYLLNEGGGIETRPNGKRYFGVSVAEKTPLWLRLTASGPAGHAAVPSPDNAVDGAGERPGADRGVSAVRSRGRSGARLISKRSPA